MMGQTTSGVTNSGTASGFVSDVTNISNGTNYIKPSAIDAKTNTRVYTIDSTKQCNTQGIYFLTDGAPTYYNYSGGGYTASQQYNQTVLENFMKKSLGTKASSFSCGNDSTLGKYPSGYSSESSMAKPNGWNCIGAYTKSLLD